MFNGLKRRKLQKQIERLKLDIIYAVSKKLTFTAAVLDKERNDLEKQLVRLSNKTKKEPK